MKTALWAVIFLCLLAACIMDCKTCMVYNVVWWISGAAALILLVLNGRQIPPETVFWLGAFAALQEILFSRMYGKADCHGFCVCAAAEASLGIGPAGFLGHMLLAFGLLAVVQAFRRNIGRDGNLKRPVPFLPYITLAFWVLLWYYNSC
ncbi:MAG: hypothetical protein NC432_07170 [Roseburia sp.]|nr:hypothetical protein [Roseburia sp.]MCM1098933.1 hypothetical protein [Ruminococcus flavefaciens]